MLLIALHGFDLDRQIALWWTGTEVICQAAGGMKEAGITLQPACQFMGCSNAFRQPFCQIDNKPWRAKVGPKGLAMCERVGSKSNSLYEKNKVCVLECECVYVCFRPHQMRALHILTTPEYITPRIVIGKWQKQWPKISTSGNSHKYAQFSISKWVLGAHVHMSHAVAPLTGYQAMLRGFSANLLLNSQHTSTNDTRARHPSWQCS